MFGSPEHSKRLLTFIIFHGLQRAPTQFVRVPPYENRGADGVKSAETETESNESRLFIDDMFEYL